MKTPLLGVFSNRVDEILLDGAGSGGLVAAVLGARALLGRLRNRGGAAADRAAEAARRGTSSAVGVSEVSGVRRRVRRRVGSGAASGGFDMSGRLLGHEASLSLAPPGGEASIELSHINTISPKSQ